MPLRPLFNTMRFIDHENPPEPPIRQWWKPSSMGDFSASTTIDAQLQMQEADLIKFFETKIDESNQHMIALLDNMMFWESARYALENGGCRQ